VLVQAIQRYGLAGGAQCRFFAELSNAPIGEGRGSGLDLQKHVAVDRTDLPIIFITSAFIA
jgi:hypothetical protein